MTPSPAPPRGSRVPGDLLALLGFLLLTLGLGHPALDAPPIRDDQCIVLANPEVRRVLPLWRHFLDPGTFSSEPQFHQYRPLVPLSYSLSHHVPGGAPRGHRLVNLLLLAWIALLTRNLVRRLLGEALPDLDPTSQNRAAWLAGTVIATHPLAHLTAGYLASRGVLQATGFFLHFLLAYLDLGECPSRRDWIRPLSWLALSLLSKQNGLVTPLLLLLLEVLVRGRSPRDPLLLRRLLPPALVAGALFLAPLLLPGRHLETSARFETPGEKIAYVASQPEVILRQYLGNYLWPTGIHWYPSAPDPSPDRPATWLTGGLWLLGIGLMLRSRGRPGTAWFGLLGFLVTLVPTSLLPWSMRAIPYRPFFGLPLLTLSLVSVGLTSGHRRVGTAIAVGWLAFLGVTSYGWHRLSGDLEALWARSLALGGTPRVELLHILTQPDPLAQIPRLESLLRRFPRLFQARTQLGLCSLLVGRHREAARLLAKALEADREDAATWLWYALALQLQGDRRAWEEALDASRRAPRPMDPEVVFWALDAAMRLGRTPLATALLPHYRNLVPRDHRGAFVAGTLALQASRPEPARALFLEARELGADHAPLFFNLALAQAASGDCSEAASSFREARRRDPALPEGTRELAACGRPREPPP